MGGKGRRARRREFALLLGGLLAALPAAEGLYRAFLWARARLNEPPPGLELYAIGGSSALGRPYRTGLPELTALLLPEGAAGRRIRAENLARGGESIYPQAVALAERIRFRPRKNPAAVLIYSGHNEFFSEPWRFRRFHRAWRRLREGRLRRSLLASGLLARVEKRLGLRGFRDLAHYELYLRAAIETSRAAGALPILSTVVANAAGIEPSLSLAPDAGLGGLSRESIEAALGRGSALEENRRWALALGYYEALGAEHPALAPYAEFRKAKCHAALGAPELAREAYWRALDSDEQKYRATRAQNELIRRLAREYGLPLVDAVELFAAKSEGGVPGDALFVDIMHPNREGYLLLAGAFAAELARAFPGTPAPRSLSPDAAFPLDSETPAAAARPLIESGVLLLLHSQRFAGARGRLALAEANLRQAAALAPESERAWIALGLAQSARAGSDYFSGAPLDWLNENRELYFSDGPVGGAARAQALAVLKRSGASPEVLTRLAAP